MPITCLSPTTPSGLVDTAYLDILCTEQNSILVNQMKPAGSTGKIAQAARISMDERYLYAGLIRLHVLHHAVLEPVYGLAMIEELARHGYKLSAGTLYPILHGMEERGLLASKEEYSG